MEAWDRCKMHGDKDFFTPSSNGAAAFFSVNEHWVSTFFSRSRGNVYSRQLVATLLFSSTKTRFLKHKVLSEYFFLPKSRQTFFPIKAVEPRRPYIVPNFSHKPDVPLSMCYWFHLKGKEVYFEKMYWLSWISCITTVHNAHKWRQNQDFCVFAIFSAF